MPTRTFPGRFESLAEISEFVKASAESAGLEDMAVYAVQLAVDEACTNIIEHAYGETQSGQIECICEVLEDGVSISLRDWGRGFDPDSVPEPDYDKPIEEVSPRGAGLKIIRKSMDEVHYEFGTPNGNVVRLFKRK